VRERTAHQAALTRLGLSPEQEAPLARYLEILEHWNRRVNLTGARTAEGQVRTLVEPVLPAVARIESGPLLDIGSGNGSPGLVLAAVRPDLEVTLLEPRQKRWVFLVEAARAMGLNPSAILRVRFQDYEGCAAGVLVVRGLRLRLADVARLVRPGGQLVAFGGTPAPEAPFAHEGVTAQASSRISFFRRGRFT
jgi:16S rRNA (guanine527-N7)-methyltransferase